MSISITGGSASVDSLKPRIARLPRKPGVYLFKNAAGKVIYVGKASDLRSRVTSYTRPDPHSPKTEQLRAEIRDLDFIITTNEVEALILENTLIKKHYPHYNVQLKDDKTYPYIKLTNEQYPRLELTRRVAADGARYFGPYSSAYGVRGTLAFLQKVFPLRMCNKKRTGPCMYFHIGRCIGPCSGEVDEDEYARNVRAVELFLKGRREELVEGVRGQMKDAAAARHFEHAAILRDRLRAIESLFRQKQEVVWSQAIDMDVLGVALEGERACAEVMFVRGGLLIGHDPFLMRAGAADTPAAVLSGFIEQYYAHRADIPGEIAACREPDDAALIEEFLTLRRGARVRLLWPQRGKRRSLALMAADNAAQRLRDDIMRDTAGRAQAAALLNALEQRLGAAAPLARIIGFDISTTMGTQTVGSAVAFQNGIPDKSGYRKFIIRGSGRDDFSSMREMAARWLRRVTAGDWPAPDLIIVDGGRGQVSAVELGIVDAEYFKPLFVMGFAKKSFESHIMGRDEPLRLERDEPAAHLVRRVIEEAHRFAITFHRKKRGEKMLHE